MFNIFDDSYKNNFRYNCTDHKLSRAMEEKVLEALNELLQDTQKIKDSYSLEDWKNNAINLIIRIYGKNSVPEKQIENMEFSVNIGFNTDNVLNRKLQAQELIRGLVKEIKRFGLPEKHDNTEEKLNVDITQSQNKETKISLSLFVESIQNELTGGQLKELQVVISDKKTDLEEKKLKIIIMLKQFGSEVAPNILANVLSNPTLFG